jgi:hypothetical protein
MEDDWCGIICLRAIGISSLVGGTVFVSPKQRPLLPARKYSW